MFGKKKENTYYIPIENGVLSVDKATYDYIMKLRQEATDAKHEKIKVEAELSVIKPIIESKQYEPAISSDCDLCKFVVRSVWNNDIIGCRKNSVCEDYAPKEED